MLVIDEPFHLSFATRELICGICRDRSLFRDQRIAAPIVCSLGEFEHLIAAVEDGVVNVGDVVRGHALANHDYDLGRYLFNQTGPLQQPRLVATGFEELWQMTIDRLGFPRPPGVSAG
jgi:hypothetical protein